MNRDLIEQYVDRAVKLRHACEGLNPADVLAKPGPGKWSIQELVIHLADSDAISIDRMKRMLCEDNPSLLYADETAYVERLYSDDQSLEDALTLLEVGRRQFARVLRKLPDEAFLRRGTHNRRGEVTVGEMVADYVKHVDDHMEFLLAKRVKLGKPLI